MNAPKMSHTVVLEKPERAQFNAALASLKPGLASCSGLKKTQGDRMATSVTPIKPIAPPGSGSNMRPTMTPTKMAKKYHACCGSPAGAGMRAMMMATATGATAFHGIFMLFPLETFGAAFSESDGEQQPGRNHRAQRRAPIGRDHGSGSGVHPDVVQPVVDAVHGMKQEERNDGEY